MKKFWKATLAIFVLVALAYVLASYLESRRSLWHRLQNPETVQKLKQFVALQAAQANADTNGVPSEIRAILEQAKRGDWLTLSNSMQAIRRWRFGWQHGWQHDWHPLGPKMAVKYFWCSIVRLAGGNSPDYLAPPDMRGACGSAAFELENAFDVFWNIDEKYSEKLGREIITSIPPGSIFIGDNDAGRLIPSVMLTPLSDSSPFYILPQWAFKTCGTDGGLQQLQTLYGKKIHLPTNADMDQCFRDFAVQLQLASATNIDTDSYGLNGMEGLAVQRLMDANPKREFYLVEQAPVTALLPHCEPHGLILKLHPQPVEKFSDEILQRDHDFWVKEIQPMIGGWLKDDTSIAEIAAFAKKAFGENNLAGFTGDASFIRSEATRAIYVKARCSIARIYAWRAKKATDETERKRMAHVADFAFRQAWVLSPYSPIAYSYADFLRSQGWLDDAIQVMETFAALPQLRGDYLATNVLAQYKQLQAKQAAKPAN